MDGARDDEDGAAGGLTLPPRPTITRRAQDISVQWAFLIFKDLNERYSEVNITYLSSSNWRTRGRACVPSVRRKKCLGGPHPISIFCNNADDSITGSNN